MRQVTVAPPLLDYIVSIIRGTRELPWLTLGASPRAAVMLFLGSKALAVLRGRAVRHSGRRARPGGPGAPSPHRAQSRSGNRGNDRRPVRRPRAGAGRSAEDLRTHAPAHAKTADLAGLAAAPLVLFPSQAVLGWRPATTRRCSWSRRLTVLVSAGPRQSASSGGCRTTFRWGPSTGWAGRSAIWSGMASVSR